MLNLGWLIALPLIALAVPVVLYLIGAVLAGLFVLFFAIYDKICEEKA